MMIVDPPNRSRPRGHSGIALMLVVIALAVASVLSVTFMRGQIVSTAIVQNMSHELEARAIAQSGLAMTISEVRANPSWRTDFPNGTWVTSQPLFGGTFTVLGEDGDDNGGDGDLADDPADPVRLTARGTFQGVSRTVRATLRPLTAGALPGADWYVSTQNGSDLDDGRTAETAKQTIRNLIESCDVRPGDTVHVGPGTYDGGASPVIGSLGASGIAGQSGRPVTFLADPTARYLTADTPGDVTLTCASANRTVVVDAPHVALSGFKITSSFADCLTVVLLINADGAALRDCEVFSSPTFASARGILIRSPAATIHGCTVYDHGQGGIHVGMDGRAEILDCSVRNTGNFGIQIAGQLQAPSQATIRRCVITDCQWGILALPDLPSIVENVLVLRCAAGVRTGIGSADLKIWHATLCGNTDGVSVANDSAPVSIVNSIIAGNTQYGLRGTANLTHDHNLVWGNATNYELTAKAANEIVVAPRFVGGGDYRLQADSPAIDVGTDAEGVPADDLDRLIRPAGVGHDLGAYEHGATDGGPALVALYEFNEVRPPEPALIHHWRLDDTPVGTGDSGGGGSGGAGSGDAWYVSTQNGTNGNGRTPATAKLTIMAVIQTCPVQPGDTIYVGPGTYTGGLQVISGLGGAGIAGTEADPVTFVADTAAEHLVDDSPGAVILSSNWTETVLIDADDIVLDGFRIANINDDDRKAVWVRNAQRVQIRNCRVVNTGRGVFVSNATCTIRNFVSNNCFVGVDIYKAATVTVLDSVVSNARFGIRCDLGSTSRMKVRRCRITGNGTGIIAQPQYNSVIENVLFDGNDMGLYRMSGYPATVHARNCTFVNSGAPAAHNISTAGAMKLTNCVFVRNGYGISVGAGTVIHWNNLLWNNTHNFSGTSRHGTEIIAAPRFVGAEDYHLLEVSPAIDAGAADGTVSPTDLDGHLQPAGTAFDLGAYEYGSHLPALTTVADDLGGLDGTAAGDVQGGAGGFGDGGTSVTFDGVDDCVVMPHAPGLLLEEGTVALRVRSDSLTDLHALFSKDAAGRGAGGHLTILTVDDRVRVIYETTDAYHVLTSPAMLQVGQWHHVAVTWGPYKYNLYIDGSLVRSARMWSGLGASSGGTGNAEPLVLGADARTSAAGTAAPLINFFQGRLDDVRIYDRALAPNQVADLCADEPVGPHEWPGLMVLDGSGADGPLDLRALDHDGITWLDGGGLRVSSSTSILGSAATRLHDALTATDAMTLALTFVPEAAATQDVIWMSCWNGADDRNLSFGNEGRSYVARVRTSETLGDALPQLASEGVLADEIQHVIMTYDGSAIKVYRNGSAAAEASMSHAGDLGSWDATMPLALVSASSGPSPWAGSFYRAAIYDQAIAGQQVVNVFNGEPPGPPDVTEEGSSGYAVQWIEAP